MLSACVFLAFGFVFLYIHALAIVGMIPALRRRVFESKPSFRLLMAPAPTPAINRVYKTSKQYDHHYLGV